MLEKSCFIVLILFLLIQEAKFCEDIADTVGNIIIHAIEDGIKENRVEDDNIYDNKISDREGIIDDNDDPNVGENDYGEYEYFPEASDVMSSNDENYRDIEEIENKVIDRDDYNSEEPEELLAEILIKDHVIKFSD